MVKQKLGLATWFKIHEEEERRETSTDRKKAQTQFLAWFGTVGFLWVVCLFVFSPENQIKISTLSHGQSLPHRCKKSWLKNFTLRFFQILSTNLQFELSF